MPNVELDDLPDEVLFTIFSRIPSLQDAVSLTATSKRLRALYHSSFFWRTRAPYDFFCSAPIRQDARPFYFSLRKRMVDERQLCTSYHAAYQHVITSALALDDKASRIIELDNALEHLPRNQFMNVIKNNIYGGVTVKRGDNQLFSKHKKMAEVIPLRDVPDHLSESYCQSSGFFLSALAACNAHLSLRVLLSNLPNSKREHCLNLIGPDLLCRATAFGHVETVKLLLEAGVSPNCYGFYFTIEHVKLEAQPFCFLLQLLRKSKRIQTKGDKIRQISQLFLEYKASIDMPMTRVIDADDGVNAVLPTIRSVILVYQNWFNQHAARYPVQDAVRIQSLVDMMLSVDNAERRILQP